MINSSICITTDFIFLEKTNTNAISIFVKKKQYNLHRSWYKVGERMHAKSNDKFKEQWLKSSANFLQDDAFMWEIRNVSRGDACILNRPIWIQVDVLEHKLVSTFKKFLTMINRFFPKIMLFVTNQKQIVQGGHSPWLFPVFETTIFIWKNFIIMLDGWTGR